MLVAYLDECLTAEKHPLVAVGGGIGSGKQWTNLLKAWNKVLKTEPEVGVFHTSDFETPEGRKGTIYEDWSEERRRTLNARLTDAMVSNQLEMAVIATVKPEEFEAVKTAQPRRYDRAVNAYFFCAYMLVRHIAEWADRLYPNQMVTYHFEEGGPHQVAFKKAYGAIAHDLVAQKEYKFWTTPRFVPKDSDPGLQIADRLVYEGAKHASHFFDDDPPERNSWSDPDNGKLIWKTRYVPTRLVDAGYVIDTRWFRKEEIEVFFREVEGGQKELRGQVSE